MGGSEVEQNGTEILQRALGRIKELETQLHASGGPSAPSPLQRSEKMTPASLADGGPTTPAPVPEVGWIPVGCEFHIFQNHVNFKIHGILQ